MRYLVLLIVLLGFTVTARAEESLTVTGPGTLSFAPAEYIPILWHIDRDYIAQTFDPPRIPKVGDCIVWSIYKVSEFREEYTVKMRVHYVPCTNPSSGK